MWPRMNGMRALELGTPGEMRERLNALVLAGRKTATTGLLAEYVEETEGLEFEGERLALLGNDGDHVATIEITGVELTSFGGVAWEHAAAEGRATARWTSGETDTGASGRASALRWTRTRRWCACGSGSSRLPECRLARGPAGVGGPAEAVAVHRCSRCCGAWTGPLGECHHR